MTHSFVVLHAAGTFDSGQIVIVPFAVDDDDDVDADDAAGAAGADDGQ